MCIDWWASARLAPKGPERLAPPADDEGTESVVKRPISQLDRCLVLELGKTRDGRVRIVASLPGREGTSSREWPPGGSWEDVRCALDSWVSDWLMMADGWQDPLV